MVVICSHDTHNVSVLLMEVLSFGLCFPICSSIVKGPSCMSFSFMFVCPRKKGFVVTTDTLSLMTKCGVGDSSDGACISSLCSSNTYRTIACTSCNNLYRYEASCENGIEGRMLNNKSRGSSGENPNLASKGVCSIPSVREALYAMSLEATRPSN
jgi:hypothetical protein